MTTVSLPVAPFRSDFKTQESFDVEMEAFVEKEAASIESALSALTVQQKSVLEALGALHGHSAAEMFGPDWREAHRERVEHEWNWYSGYTTPADYCNTDGSVGWRTGSGITKWTVRPDGTVTITRKGVEGALVVRAGGEVLSSPKFSRENTAGDFSRFLEMLAVLPGRKGFDQRQNILALVGAWVP